MSERLGYNPNQIPLKEKDQVVKLIQREQKAWKIKDIPPPPDGLFNALERANEQGYTTLEPHYFPEREFAEDSNWPGAGIKPATLFWELIQKGSLPKSAKHLYEMWTLIDCFQLNQTPPSFSNVRKFFDEENKGDGLASLLKKLREEEKIKIRNHRSYLPYESRIGISWDELHMGVNPAIADLLEIPRQMARQLRVIEFNLIGNLFHTEWGKTPLWEWAEDEVMEDETSDHLIVGNSASSYLRKIDPPLYSFDYAGGLRNVNSEMYDYYTLSKFLNTSFRPMITFPTQK